MTYTHKTFISVMTVAVASWGILPMIVLAEDDDDDKENGARVSASVSVHAKVKANGNGRVCKIAPPGHLIAPGFLKKNEKPKLPPCQILPPGIMKRLIDMEKKGRKEKKPDIVSPFILAVRVDNVADTSARIRWETHEKATTQVAYGTTASYGSRSPLDATLTKEHAVTLTGLQASTAYHFRVESKDAAGNLATSADFTLTTTPTPPPPPPADTTAPTISLVTSFMVTTGSAMIYWQTDEPADGQVLYGESTSYGQSSVLQKNLSRMHIQALTGLSASTMYHFKVQSRDSAGNLAVSADATFTTGTPPPPPPADTTAPVISDVSASEVTSDSATISWKTDEATDGQVSYGTTAPYGSSSNLHTDRTTSHTFVLRDLSASTMYHFQVRSRDAAGNLSVSADGTFTTSADSTEPEIADITVTTVTRSTALINWTTNEETDARVYFSKSFPVDKKTAASVSSSGFFTVHTLQLYGLEANTTYSFLVEAKDRAGNVTTSAVGSFRTLP
ncbi:fibronectin type III domain-containing protein [Candidatus Uhrbacteria bacterium]|nr:fibronectin type III domain-containing protein [Candidatus Uhrbacteria bacterium]